MGPFIPDDKSGYIFVNVQANAFQGLVHFSGCEPDLCRLIQDDIFEFVEL